MNFFDSPSLIVCFEEAKGERRQARIEARLLSFRLCRLSLMSFSLAGRGIGAALILSLSFGLTAAAQQTGAPQTQPPPPSGERKPAPAQRAPTLADFNIDIGKGDCAWLKVADDHEVIRVHALGGFPDLLRASALSPAMLWYLDGRVNRRARPEERPNENYARELLELHTLGVHGGYTQGDVMEVARCLTGWTVRPRSGFRKGRVEFHAHEHDDGAKTVLGRRIAAGGGERDLHDVLDLVASYPTTSRHIATKLCRRFIADEPPETAVAAVAEMFRTSGGDIRQTLRTLLTRPEFVSARGTKLKRPFHYLVSALRSTDALTDGASALSDVLTSMGHAPFQYPTPEGYAAGAAAWERTLIWRWKFAAALAANRVEGTRIDVEGLIRRAGGERSLMAHVLGRQPNATEQEAWKAMGGRASGLALLLASPAFQRC